MRQKRKTTFVATDEVSIVTVNLYQAGLRIIGRTANRETPP